MGIRVILLLLLQLVVSCNSDRPGETGITHKDLVDHNKTSQRVLLDEANCGFQDALFTQQVLPLLDSFCFDCHNIEDGTNAFNLSALSGPDSNSKNFTQFKKYSYLNSATGLPLILDKSANISANHIGGEIFSTQSKEYGLLSSQVSTMIDCDLKANSSDALVLLTPQQQLRKTIFSLADRLPTESEVSFVNNAISDVQARLHVKLLVDDIFQEDGFYIRLKEIFNDLFYTDQFGKNAKGLSLALDDYANQNYFGVTELMELGYSTAESNALRQFASDGISQAALELVSYVVKNNKPFTEILTADYQMINPYSATIFSITLPDDPGFNFEYFEPIELHDSNDFVPARLIDNKSRTIPHAGVLTTQAFLGRYPSSPSNRNRKRAKNIARIFLDTDVEALANRAALDLQNVIGLHPSLEDPQCKTCHDVVDPIAGLFKNWNVKGRFLGNNQYWFDVRNPPEMLAPGYSLTMALPQSNSSASLQWLAKTIASDVRFLNAIVKHVFKALVGLDVSLYPATQQRLADEFFASNFNFKALVKSIVSSQHFIINNLNAQASLSDFYIGTTRLLSPERLQRKLTIMFPDYQWQSPSKRNLVASDSYRLLFGGIDSETILDRIETPSVFINGIQMRLANQVSCEFVPLDFSRPLNRRVLFPFVEPDVKGLSPGEEIRIKDSIRHLFFYLLGEEKTITSIDVSRVWDLYQRVMSLANVDGISQDCYGNLPASSTIVKDAQGTVQAWMAVVNFMLRDYKFLYE